MGENDDGLVYGVPCQEEGDQRLFGVPRMTTKKGPRGHAFKGSSEMLTRTHEPLNP
jgi:hypothetical protein